MKNLLKKLSVSVLVLTMSTGLIAVVACAETKIGSYSKLVGTNDSGNNHAIATMINTSGSSRYSQLFMYRGNKVLISNKEKIVSSGSSLQIVSTNSYKKIYAISTIYNSGSPNSGVVEGLQAQIKP